MASIFLGVDAMRILITGAGGAAAISVWKSLHTTHEVFMGDIDPLAAGLYLVPATHRLILPRGDATNFAESILKLALENKINLVVATVDAELVPLATYASQFEEKGIKLPLSSSQTLSICFDKRKLLDYVAGHIPIPETKVLSSVMNLNELMLPLFAKPRRASGSSGAMVIDTIEQLQNLPPDESYLIQELLPGDEYSVDVYINQKGEANAAVPRLRMKIDSGIAVASQTKILPALSELAIQTAKLIGISFVANIQFKQSKEGIFKLLEVNPRFSGTLPLTTAAGIDIPKLLISDLENLELPNSLLPFKELMVVRYWTEIYLPLNEWEDVCQKQRFS